MRFRSASSLRRLKTAGTLHFPSPLTGPKLTPHAPGVNFFGGSVHFRVDDTCSMNNQEFHTDGTDSNGFHGSDQDIRAVRIPSVGVKSIRLPSSHRDRRSFPSLRMGTDLTDQEISGHSLIRVIAPPPTCPPHGSGRREQLWRAGCRLIRFHPTSTSSVKSCKFLNPAGG